MNRPLLLIVLIACTTPVSQAHAAVPTDPTLDPTSESILIDTVDSVVDGSSFRLTSQVLVTTGSQTAFSGIDGVADLLAGDLVHVAGERWQDLLAASSVALLQASSEPTVVQGEVALTVPEEGALVLFDGTRGQVHSGTEYVVVSSLEEVVSGDTVVLTGTLDRWTSTMRVDRLERLAVGAGTHTLWRGTVASVTPPDRVALVDGSVLVVAAATTLLNFDAITDLVAGDVLDVEAFTTEEPGVLDAVALQRVEIVVLEVSFSDTVVTVDAPATTFSTAEGYTVSTDEITMYVNLDGPADLAPGLEVRVQGTATSADPRTVRASLIELLDSPSPPQGGQGLVTVLRGTVDALVRPSSFILDASYTIVTDPETQWYGGLSGFGSLTVGMVVEATATWSFDGSLRALSVTGLDAEGAGIVALSGIVIEIEAGTDRYLLDGGQWLVIEDSTPVDGDVDAADQIERGMWLSADGVALPDGDFLALLVFVVADLGFDLPWSTPTGLETFQALVVLVPGANPEVVAWRHQATVTGRLPGTLVHLFVWPGPIAEEDFVLLSEDPDVEEVEVNSALQDPETIRRRLILVDGTASSAEYVRQPALTDVSLTSAHARTTGLGALVAVIDTGVDPLHPLLRHRVAAGGRDFVDDDPYPWETSDGVDQDADGDVDEAAGHGTFVAGLVLLAAPSASILPYRVLDDDGNGTTFDVCQAMIDAMDRGADVINMSLAYSQRSRVLDRILDEATRRGVVLVSGAGNDGLHGLPFPASDRHVLAVAAVDTDRALAEFSNYGFHVAIAAPGVELYSGGADGVFGTWSGTSMAAPLVSGAVALLRSVNPYLRPEEIAAALRQSAVPLTGDPHGVPGILQIDSALALVPDAPR